MGDEQVFAHAEALYGKDTVYAFYPHYWSTYCIHHLHADCRLTCKTCHKACLCYCHQSGQGAPIDGVEEGS